MAYLRPAVLVYQEYARLTSATQQVRLTPCIIGPAYHIINPITDDPLPFVSDYSVAGIQHAEFPFNTPGGKVDFATVEVMVRQAYIQLNSAAVTDITLTDNILAFTSSAAFPANIKVGDTVEVHDTDDSGSGDPVVVTNEYLVIDVKEDDLELHLNFTPPAATGTLSANFLRFMDQVWFTAESPYLTFDQTNTTFSLVGAKVTIGNTEYDLIKGLVYVGYRSMRVDMTQLNTVYSIEEARGVFGRDLSDKNPLGFAVALTLANTNVGVSFVGVPSQDLQGYTDAKDLLEGTEDVYAVVPLTQNVDVLTMFKNHAEMMSTPEEGAWRITLGSCPLPTSKIRVDKTGTVSISGSGDLVILYSEEGLFFSNGVRSGHNLILTTNDGSTKKFIIEHVVSQDRLVFKKTDAFNLADYDELQTIPFIVEHIFNKDDQAHAIKEISEGYKSSRFVNVWPNICIIDEKRYPGYYLCCLLAGMIGGLPPHHGFTRLALGGVSGVRNSSDYFNKYQLDTIASGGTFVFMQSNPASPVYCRHQLTTDMSTIEFRELSFVKNFDYVSYLAKRILDRYIGQYNITNATLAMLHTSLTSMFEVLKLSSLPRIGSPVLGYNISSIRQLDTTRDRVEIYIDVEFPYVLNVVGLHIVSQ